MVVGLIANAYPDLFSGPVRLFLLLIVWIYLVIVIKNIVKYFSVVGTDYQSKRAIFVLRNLLLERCLLFGKSFFDKNKIYKIHQTISESSVVVEKQLTLFKNLIIQFSLLVVFVLSMLYVSWTLTLVSLILFPLVSLIVRKIIRSIRGDLGVANATKDRMNHILSNILNGIFVVQGFSKETKEKKIFLEKNKEDLERGFRIKKLSNLISAIEDVGDTTMILLVALGMALVMHRVGGIDATHAFVFLYLTQKISPILNFFNNFSLRMEELGKSIEDVNFLLNENDGYVGANGKTPFKELTAGISIKNLSFSYAKDSEPALSDINVFFEKGKLTAIAGPSGSGKSTLLSLMLRFYEVESGLISIDGVDIREFDKYDLRRGVSFVGQDSVLFNDSLINNIMYGTESETLDVKKREVLSELKIDAFVQKLPKKYDTLIAEKGANLSGGQKQRISIARALFSDCQVLLLDEVTNSLDPIMESRVFDVIRRHAKEKTCIMASHRLSLMRKADTIVYIENGSIVEQGSWDELVSLKGQFFKQLESQGLR